MQEYRNNKIVVRYDPAICTREVERPQSGSGSCNLSASDDRS